jgi:hypothetical protein
MSACVWPRCAWWSDGLRLRLLEGRLSCETLSKLISRSILWKLNGIAYEPAQAQVHAYALA